MWKHFRHTKVDAKLLFVTSCGRRQKLASTLRDKQGGPEIGTLLYAL